MVHYFSIYLFFFYYTRHIPKGKGEVNDFISFVQELQTPGCGKVNVFSFNTDELEYGNYCVRSGSQMVSQNVFTLDFLLNILHMDHRDRCFTYLTVSNSHVPSASAFHRWLAFGNSALILSLSYLNLLVSISPATLYRAKSS